MIKKVLILLCLHFFGNKIISGQDSLCESCVEYKLAIDEHKLQGSSLQFPGYDVSMNLPLDFSIDSLNKDSLFSMIRNHDIRGDFIFPNGTKTEIRYSLIPYKGSTTIFMKTSNGWFPWDKIRIENNKLIFSYDYWYYPPASKMDLQIINLCFDFFKDSTSWNRNDDRKCDDNNNNKSWSLFCAIHTATIKIMGEYNHRGYVVQMTRNVIGELYPNRKYNHILEEFNNDSSTNYSDILKVMNSLREKVDNELIK